MARKRSAETEVRHLKRENRELRENLARAELVARRLNGELQKAENFRGKVLDLLADEEVKRALREILTEGKS